MSERKKWQAIAGILFLIATAIFTWYQGSDAGWW